MVRVQVGSSHANNTSLARELNSDGTPVKYDNERMPFDGAVVCALPITVFVQNCKKCLREVLSGGESELADV